MIKNILLTSGGGLGNTILFTPTIKVIRKNFPYAKISLLISSKSSADVVSGNHYIDEILYYKVDQKYHFLKNLIRYVKYLRKYKFDLVIVCGEEGIFGALSFFLAGIKHRIAHKYKLKGPFNKVGVFYTMAIERNLSKHEVEHNLDLARALDIKIHNKDKQTFIYFTNKEKKFAENFLKINKIDQNDFIIGIHPGSLQKKKRWSIEKFADLIKKLKKEYNAKIIVFGGPDEISIEKELRKKTNDFVSAVGKTDIKQAAALIEKCNLFISNDSGLMHVASAVKTPIVAIFGPTNYIKNSPWQNKNNFIIIRKELLCYGSCFVPYVAGIKCNTMKCLKIITVKDVLNAVKELIKRKIK